MCICFTWKRGVTGPACIHAREAAKKVTFLVARPLNPYPLEPSGHRNIFSSSFSSQKFFFFFFLVAQPLPPPLLVAGPLKKRQK